MGPGSCGGSLEMSRSRRTARLGSLALSRMMAASAGRGSRSGTVSAAASVTATSASSDGGLCRPSAAGRTGGGRQEERRAVDGFGHVGLAGTAEQAVVSAGSLWGGTSGGHRSGAEPLGRRGHPDAAPHDVSTRPKSGGPPSPSTRPMSAADRRPPWPTEKRDEVVMRNG